MAHTTSIRPTIKHLYQNHSMDSRRWNYFTPRDGDVVVGTSYKAGTTWVQMIVANLIFDGRLPGAIDEFAPWLDMRLAPLEVVLGGLEAQTNRRSMKTHLPLDSLPYHRNIKYIYVARDARDVFMSWWNFYGDFTPQMIAMFNSIPGRVGPELVPCSTDIHELWHNWMTRGLFDWETEGYPFWSVLHHAQSWWDFRHLDNILLVHYADLLADLEGGMRRIAKFLAIEPAAASWPQLVKNCTFSEMRAKGGELMPMSQIGLKGGPNTFFNKGTNGRWRDVLSVDELKLYDTACTRELTPDCRHWLENGGEM
jgi:aryl sulfotransferase